MPLSHIVHKGKRIVFMDFTNCKSEREMIDSLHEFADYFRGSAGGELALSDFTGTFGSMQFMTEVKKLRTEVFYRKTRKGALIGITGGKRILVMAYNKIANREVLAFKTKEEALDYLAEDS